MSKNIIIVLIFMFLCIRSSADISTGQVSIYDSAGNTLDSTTGSLHVKLQGSTVTVAPTVGTFSNSGGTTDVTPGTFISIFNANPTRKYLLIINTDPVGKLYVDFISPSLGSSIVLNPGGSFVMEANFVTGDEVFVTSDISESNFTAKEGN